MSYSPQHMAYTAKCRCLLPYFLHILWILAIFQVTFPK
ncbi:hypothetical protein RKLH11_2467 [Rhodobacteraceae bacterium KLH11]|nr:hypothetical protein RKLH11_2467 [Rhodobacteraceae bacterium KLH11]